MEQEGVMVWLRMFAGIRRRQTVLSEEGFCDLCLKLLISETGKASKFPWDVQPSGLYNKALA